MGRSRRSPGQERKRSLRTGSAAKASPISGPSALLPDSLGGLYFEEEQAAGVSGNVLRYITPAGLLKTIAGTGKGGFSGDGGPAIQATVMIQYRTGLALDKSANLYFSDSFNSRVRVISNGTINTFAGNGTAANSGDGGAALSASFVTPRGLLFDAQGDLLISDIMATASAKPWPLRRRFPFRPAN